MMRAELDALFRAGKVPRTLSKPLNLLEAASWVETFPPVQSVTSAPDGTGGVGPAPRGYGLLPPRGVPPLVRVKSRLQDPYGKTIPANAQGLVGALWNHGGRVVLRLWFRWGEEAEHGWTRGPVDIYDDQIKSVCGLGGEVPRLPGWELVRLDDGSAESMETKRAR